MIVKNFGSYHLEDYERVIREGGRFMYYPYCLSGVIYSSISFTDVYLVRTRKERILKAIWYGMISILFGWWAIPWGPIYTFQCLFVIFQGGYDVTGEVWEDVKSKLNPSSQYF